MLAVAFAVASAGAETVHKPLFQLAEIPAEGPHGEKVALPEPIRNMESMTVDSGHLWVAEDAYAQWSRVNEFDAGTGAFLAQPVAYEADYEKEGKFLTGYGEGYGQGIVVGHDGGGASVYVGGESNGMSVVSSFNEAGAPQGTWSGAATPGGTFGRTEEYGRYYGAVTDVAVDNSADALDLGKGDVYVALRSGAIDVFHPETAGEERYVGQIKGVSPSEPFVWPAQIAVDEATGELFVLDERWPVEKDDIVDVFRPGGLGEYEFVRSIEAPPGGSFQASMAVDGGAGRLYVGAIAPEGDYVTAPGVVDEFSTTGAYLGHVEWNGDGRIAVDPETHDLFVGRQAFGPDIVVPDVTTEAVSGQSPRSVTLNGTVDPDGAGDASCQFDYGTTLALGHVAPCSEPVPNGEGARPVQAVLSGLERNTTYYYRLQAGNKNGTNIGLPVQDQRFTTKGAVVHAAFVSGVLSDSATLGASIDPGSTPTSYYFQYGLSSAYEYEAPAAPGQSIGSSRGVVEVPAVYVGGLAPGTVYHYRVVAISEPQPGELETLYSPDRTFTTQVASGSFSLLDGRQWELVSPADKHGALIQSYHNNYAPGVSQAAAGGGAIVYRASSPTESEPAGFAHEVTVLSTRGAGGWSSLDISEPALASVYPRESIGQEFQIFSEDLSRAAVQPIESVFTPLSSEASEATPYLRNDYLGGNAAEVCHSDCYRALVTGKAGFANVPPGTVFGEEPEGFCEIERCGPKFQGASPDLGHIVLSSQAQLTSTPAPAGGEGLYEWSEGKLQLLDLLPKGEAGPAVLAGSAGAAVGVRNSVSEDGERVVMEGGAGGGDGLYLREVLTGETIRLDVPQGASGPSEDARYMDASADASRIFFLDSGRLTADSSPSGADLYEYDSNAPVGERLRDLSVPASAGASAGVATMIGTSEDGSYVYFAAGGALASGAVEGECPQSASDMEADEKRRAQEGREPSPGCNVYLSHEGVTRLVAVLPGDDWYDWSRQLGSSEGLYARVAPAGGWLALLSEGELTGYDTHDAASGQPDTELYLYDAASGKLSCASCDPTGERPTGRFLGKEQGLDGHWSAVRVPWWSALPGEFGSAAVYQRRYLSDSGRVFFDSMGALVAQDVNGAEDVYEWEPAGVGSCSDASTTFSSRSGGCADLVSSGTSPEPSELIDASETGGDVFFRTLARLAPQDYDNAFDVYDAHECTSAVPCPPVRVAPPACSTEASCKAPPAPQSALYGAPASATFSGIGNAPQTTAPAVAGKTKPKSTQKTKGKRKTKAKRRRGQTCGKRVTGRRCARAGGARRAGRARVGRVGRGGGR
jgi:hypothetical protein